MMRRALAALALLTVVAACDAASTSSSPAVPAATSGATLSPATSVPTTHPSAPPPSAAEPTGAPTSEALVLGGSWLSPKAGAKLASHTTTLSAMPTASGSGVTTFTKVVFSATWPGAKRKTMCTAKAPGSEGAWACKANLLALGVPPGKVTFSFDVHGEGVPTATSPDGPRKITYAVPPPRPTDTDLTQIKPPDFESEDSAGTYRVDWSAPDGYADEFIVYYTRECPPPATEKNSGDPCFVAGTPVDASQLEVLARASGDARSVRVHIDESDCEGIGGSILLRARNAYGRSPFAIVLGAHVFWHDPNDTVC